MTEVTCKHPDAYPVRVLGFANGDAGPAEGETVFWLARCDACGRMTFNRHKAELGTGTVVGK